MHQMLPQDKTAPAASQLTGAVADRPVKESPLTNDSTTFMRVERRGVQRIHRSKPVKIGGTL